MRLAFIILSTLTLSFLATAADAPAVPGNEINSILGTVNGKPISLGDVLGITANEEYKAYAAYSGEALKEKLLEIRKKAVDMLIDRQLLLDDFARSELTLREQDVETEMDEAALRMGVRSRSDFARKLSENGTTIEKFRQELTDHMKIQLMLYRRFVIDVSITPRDVYEYYQQHPENFSKPESVELAMIMLNKDREDLSARVEEIRRILERDPEDFPRLAENFSDSPGRKSGGKLGELEVRRLRPEFAAALDKIEVGKCYGPIATPEGIAFLRVLAHRNAAVTALEDAALEIRRQLEDERRQLSRDRYLESLRKEAVIRYYFPE